METQDNASRRQYIAVGFCALLSPTVRTLPALVTPYAAEHAWISALAAIIPFLLISAMLGRFMRSMGPGEGMAELFIRSLGKVIGRALLLLFGLWLLFYAAFIMRSAAHRFISAIFPESSLMAYIPVMGLLACITGLGQFKVLARSAEVIRPLLLAVLCFTLFFSLPEVRWDTFSMPIAQDALPILRGVVPILNVAGPLCYLSFAANHTKPGPGMTRTFALWLTVTAALLSALCFTTVGSFGPELIELITNPYLVMIRNIRITNTMERVEALVIAIWFFTDFILVAALMHSSVNALSRAIGITVERSGSGGLLSGGRWLVVLSALAAAVCALFLAPNTQSLTRLSMQLIPALNLFFSLVLLPAVFLVGMVRKRV
ncbi:MAG: GerAB/ArcD/ProY family transporter [Candidatus Heteroscillospira sp.]